MARPPFPSKTALQRSIDHIVKAGGIILVHHEPCGGAETYQLLNGKPVSAKTFQKLKVANAICASGDGLIDGFDQTYCVRGILL